MPGTTSPLQKGQPLRPDPGGSAAQARVGHADDASHDDEEEGGDDGRPTVSRR